MCVPTTISLSTFSLSLITWYTICTADVAKPVCACWCRSLTHNLLRSYDCHFFGFRLAWHFTSGVIIVVLPLTILALLKCCKNIPFLTYRWFTKVSVRVNLNDIDCSSLGPRVTGMLFWMSYLTGDNILTGVGRAHFWMSLAVSHQGLYNWNRVLLAQELSHSDSMAFSSSSILYFTSSLFLTIYWLCSYIEI